MKKPIKDFVGPIVVIVIVLTMLIGLGFILGWYYATENHHLPNLSVICNFEIRNSTLEDGYNCEIFSSDSTSIQSFYGIRSWISLSQLKYEISQIDSEKYIVGTRDIYNPFHESTSSSFVKNR